MTVRFLGQSGYILKTADSQIIIDPYLSDSVNRVAGRPRVHPVPIEPEEICCDAVICSHNHLDHLDTDTAARITNDQPFITTREGKGVLEGMGKKKVTAITEGQGLRVGDFEITAVFAKHTVEAFGLIIRAEGTTLYFSGDTLYDPKLFEIAGYKPQITFICINGRLGNMNTAEAIKTAEAIGAPINIPNHYDMFESNSADPTLFADNIKGGKILEFNREYSVAKLIKE